MANRRKVLGDILAEAVADSLGNAKESMTKMDAAGKVVNIDEARIEAGAACPSSKESAVKPFAPKAVRLTYPAGNIDAAAPIDADAKTRAIHMPKPDSAPAGDVGPGPLSGVAINHSEKMDMCPGCFQAAFSSQTCANCGYRHDMQEEHPMFLPLGTPLLDGRYIIGKVLGQGGFGVTYLGYDKFFQRRVAIKEYMPSHLASRHRDSVTVIPGRNENEDYFSEGLKLFLGEARNVAGLSPHESIVRVENYFEGNNTGYMVMQYVEGPSLSEFVKSKGGKLDWQATVDILLPIMDALKGIHKKKLFHRDISIQNILLKDGKVPVLIDFGAARVVASDKSRSIDVVLKPGYSPLEQFASKGKIGAWTDIYAVGACIYLLVCGHLPPQATDRLYKDEFLPLSEISGVQVSDSVDYAIHKALAVRVEDRWQSVSEFMDALMQLAAPQQQELEQAVAMEEKEQPMQGKSVKEVGLPAWLNMKTGAVAVVATLIVVVLSVLFVDTGGKPSADANDSVVSTETEDFPLNDAVPSAEETSVDNGVGSSTQTKLGSGTASKKISIGGGSTATATQMPALKEAESELLALAKRQLKDGHYVNPKGRNAYESYLYLLGGSKNARTAGAQGLASLVQQADAFIASGAWSKGRAILLAMQDVPDNGVAKRVSSSLDGVTEKYYASAEKYVEQGVGMIAITYLEKVIEVQPQNEKAQTLLTQAKKLKGKLNIFCNPWGKLFIDDVDMNMIAPRQGILLVAGEHTIRLVNPSSTQYKKREGKVTIVKGKVALLTVNQNKFSVSYE